MAQYRYKVRDAKGELATGTVQAATIDDAGAMLRGEGKFIVKLEQAMGFTVPGNAARHRRSGRISRDDVITFAHQLAVMVDTGVPISQALESVAEQVRNPAFHDVLQDVTERVQAGGELSAALNAYPKVFPRVMVNLVRASEASGTMGPMLERVSSYLTKERQTAKKIRGALTYPAVMFVMVIAVTIFILTFVLPKFAVIYQSKGAALPLPTRLLISLSGTLINLWWLWIGGIVVVIAGLMLAARTAFGRRVFDFFKLHAPVIGGLFNKLYLTRTCRTMGTLIAAGVPILDMVEIVRNVSNNAYYEDLWNDIDDRLRQGSQLSDMLFNSSLIPRSVAQMVYAGEKSGRLGDVLDRISQYTEDDFDTAVKTATQFIEPMMVLLMGLIIGFIAIALLLPIFTVGRVMAGN